LVIALAVDRLIYAMAIPDVVTTVCTPCVSGIVLVGIVVGVVVVAVHDLWVYSLTIFGNCGVDELPAASGHWNIEAIVWPWINVVLFDALPLIAACSIVIPLAVNARRFRRSAVVILGGGSDPMAMIHAALATLVIYIACVLPTSVFNLTVYYRPPLLAAPNELAAYYSALTVVSLIKCVQSCTVYIAFFAAVTKMRSAVCAALPELRRAGNTTADSTAQMASFEPPHTELEMLDIARSGDENHEQTSTS